MIVKNYPAKLYYARRVVSKVAEKQVQSCELQFHYTNFFEGMLNSS